MHRHVPDRAGGLQHGRRDGQHARVHASSVFRAVAAHSAGGQSFPTTCQPLPYFASLGSQETVDRRRRPTRSPKPTGAPSRPWRNRPPAATSAPCTPGARPLTRSAGAPSTAATLRRPGTRDRTRPGCPKRSGLSSVSIERSPNGGESQTPRPSAASQPGARRRRAQSEVRDEPSRRQPRPVGPAMRGPSVRPRLLATDGHFLLTDMPGQRTRLCVESGLGRLESPRRRRAAAGAATLAQPAGGRRPSRRRARCASARWSECAGGRSKHGRRGRRPARRAPAAGRPGRPR